MGQQKPVTGTGFGRGFLISILRECGGVMGMEEGKPEQLWGSSCPCTAVLIWSILNPVAVAVTPVSPNYRKTVPKLDSLHYICIN